MATAREPQRVSAAEFIRGFANWRMQAARKPVVVTHHGKDAHVLISLDDYRRLDNGGAATSANALQDSLALLIESIAEGAIVIDRQWRILSVNPAASDMIERAAADLIGAELAAALPELGGSLLFQRIIRLLDHRERFSGDMPGLLRPRQWLHVDLVPLPVGGAILLRDVSEAMDDIAATDVRQALATVIDIDGSVGHARLSVRETVDTANEALTAMVGVDAAAIRRVRFSALLAVGHRAAFSDAIESVFRSGEPVRIASQIVTRDGIAIDVMLSIAEVRGAYASEGAVVLVTRYSAG
ncbi:PAS domain-containing protein [Sphingopyxis macrogoltabida]|uniref:PAS sensor protein n=1 Tax=Sphingopyxis macrogoltabida TaxID=33050 RepID=A0AAC9AV71_SPHMC|nr:PAS domain-containing protein [Sphingopyxis macrogoltabida]ALJ13055.1 PAS/PAC sensor protein [Sphingopyxis macrogoltabida]AMU89479.1 PAS sensor protein [Sphingopyxis macrogoltabida]